MLQPNITVTAAAEKFIRRMVRFSVNPTGGFRLTVSPGGCSGYTSEFTVEAAPQANDSEVSINGMKLFLPAESRLMLDGVTIDFAETPTSSGLTFINPNAAACACSSSSDAAPPAEASVSVASITRRSPIVAR
jgi:iron-sulfur cluster assembly accessory protein